jgi:transposase InsO family protein
VSVFIESGSPWQNPFVERFRFRIRDELLAVEQFSWLAEPQLVIDDWRHDYNHRRPHFPPGMMPPAKFAGGVV